MLFATPMRRGFFAKGHVYLWEHRPATVVKSTVVNAPYIEEFPFVLECKVIHQIEIGLHTQFIGEVMDIKADEGVLDEKSALDIEKVRPFFYAPGSQTYYRMGDFLGAAFSIGQVVKKKP